MLNTSDTRVQEQLQRWDILAANDPAANSQWNEAARLGSLHGKTGGFLGNRKDNANPLLLAIKELLDKQFELSDSLVMDKFIYSRPAADNIVDALSERCDFVVTAIAD
jgi:hypothetical protein